MTQLYARIFAPDPVKVKDKETGEITETESKRDFGREKLIKFLDDEFSIKLDTQSNIIIESEYDDDIVALFKSKNIPVPSCQEIIHTPAPQSTLRELGAFSVALRWAMDNYMMLPVDSVEAEIAAEAIAEAADDGEDDE